MKNPTAILLLLAVSGLFLMSSCNCTEQKCRDKFGMIKPDECPPAPEPQPSPCTDGESLKSLAKAEAAAYISAAKAGSPTFISGSNASPCQLYLLSQLSQDIFIVLGKKPDNSYLIIGKYYLANGDSAYADVTGNVAGGPTCPPSTRCN